MIDPGKANQQMVIRMIVQEALWSRSLIRAFRSTPRHLFLDRIFQHTGSREVWQEIVAEELTEEILSIIYADRALTTRLSGPPEDRNSAPISSSSQPSLMALMLEELYLEPEQRVLEVGAGTGYNAALMASVVGPDRVWSMDVDRRVLAEAEQHLLPFADRGIHLVHGDGREGLPEEAPFDRIMVTAATPDLMPFWIHQLQPGGYLSAPMVPAPGISFLVRGTVQNGLFHGRFTRPAFFMTLRSENGYEEDEIEEPFSAKDLQEIRAPWEPYTDHRRGHLTPHGLAQAVAFLGWAQGSALSVRFWHNEELLGLGAERAEPLLWIGKREWLINGPEGHEMANELWKQFLNLGAPWPTEYAVTIVPDDTQPETAIKGYHRRGAYCSHYWRPLQRRERPPML